VQDNDYILTHKAWRIKKPRVRKLLQVAPNEGRINKGARENHYNFAQRDASNIYDVKNDYNLTPNGSRKAGVYMCVYYVTNGVGQEFRYN
jgi:hypothetical protein